ncbi:MAG: alpha-ketoglutarate-dependent dioxygenase AlkB [Opitutales bacterium]
MSVVIQASKRRLGTVKRKSSTLDLPDAEATYHPALFSHAESKHYLRALTKHIEWRQNRIKFYGKESLVPRLEAWYGDEGKSYTYSGIAMHPKPWTPELLTIKERIESTCDTTFNSVLLNRYRDGSDRVAWHSDDEKELGQTPSSPRLASERNASSSYATKGTNKTATKGKSHWATAAFSS